MIAKKTSRHNCFEHLVQLFSDTSCPGKAHIAHLLGYDAYYVCRECGAIYKAEDIESDPDNFLYTKIPDFRQEKAVIAKMEVWNRITMEEERARKASLKK